MRIAVIGPMDSLISINSTGGTEIWSATFVNALVGRGHDVTLFACAGSETLAKLVPVVTHDQIIDEVGKISKQKFAFYSISEMVELVKRQDDFDICHLSVYSFHYYLPLTKLLKCPIVVTFHGSSMSSADLSPIFQEYTEPEYVFISNSFASKWPEPIKKNIIYNGITPQDFPYSQDGGKSFLWLGRICNEKGTVEAIKAAQEAKVSLRLAGSITDQDYFSQKVEPLLNDSITYVGKVTSQEKINLYQQSKAILMPINWDEPFGLVAVEAMACGTPVIGYRRGALPEIIPSDKLGYLVEPNNQDQLVSKIREVCEMSVPAYQQLRQNVSRHVIENFSMDRMVDSYESVYAKAKRNEK